MAIFNRTINESISVADGQERVKAFNRENTESLTVSDSVEIAPERRNVDDAFGISETLSVGQSFSFPQGTSPDVFKNFSMVKTPLPSGVTIYDLTMEDVIYDGTAGAPIGPQGNVQLRPTAFIPGRQSASGPINPDDQDTQTIDVTTC